MDGRQSPNLPCDLPRCLVRTGPKESSLKLVYIEKDGWRDDQLCGGVDHLGGDHGLDKSRPSNGGDALALISC